MRYKGISICLALLLIASLVFIGATNVAHEDVSYDMDIAATTADQQTYSYKSDIDICNTSILGKTSSMCYSTCEFCAYYPEQGVKYTHCVGVTE